MLCGTDSYYIGSGAALACTYDGNGVLTSTSTSALASKFSALNILCLVINFLDRMLCYD